MKVVGGKKYVHVSAVNQLKQKEQERLAQAYQKVLHDAVAAPSVTVIVVAKDTIEFVQCPDWDIHYEPIIYGRFIVKGDTVIYNASNTTYVYHKRHLFVNPDYFGFDVKDDKKRGDYLDSLGLDKKLIGKRTYWRGVLTKYKLPARCV